MNYIRRVHISELRGVSRTDTIPLVTDHHRVINMTVSSTTTAVAVQDVTKALADIEAAKNKVVTVLQAHITEHQKAAAQHNAEVAAAQALIQRAMPSATEAQSEAAAFVLTSHSSWVSGVVNFLGKNWRYVTLGLIVLGVIAACSTGLVKL
jgi:hypothetical protein